MPEPLYQYPEGSGKLPTLSPSEHLRMLVELLQPAGPDLARRWLAALLAVDRAEREALVAEVEKRVAARYGAGGGRADEIDVVHEPTQREGYVEQVTVTYGKVAEKTGERERKRA